MEKEVNIAQILKECPKGIELYSPIFGRVYLNEIRPHLAILVTTDKYKEEFLYDGRYGMNGECMLFPSKGVRTWEGIEAPFRDGDIVSTDDGIYTAIVRRVVECEIGDLYDHDESYETYCHIYYEEEDDKVCFNIDDTPLRFCRLANEEEKGRLFHAMKENGYKWDAENKTLEKLSPSKFDITTLKPFDKVLVMYDITSVWTAVLYSHYDKEMPESPFCCMGAWFERCIPYEGNEHLLGTDEECDEYYKI